jgi:NAD(P)-dependent dehydrogenase (short-subunit alcohol dehydrogenase family)
MDSFRLDGKHVLITGASSGIGRQIALVAARQGASVTVTGRDEARLAETFAALPSGEHRQLRADLRDAEQIAQLVDGAGPLDGVVHAAGIPGPAPIKMVSRAFVQDRLDANYIAPVMLTQRMLVKNAIRNNGSILFIASISAHTGTAGMGIYSATKAGLVATAECLALELARRRIRVNCLSPAIVRTPFFKPEEQEWLKETEKRYPLGLGEPDDVANAAMFMLADASRWITGQALIMDGACPWI